MRQSQSGWRVCIKPPPLPPPLPPPPTTYSIAPAPAVAGSPPFEEKNLITSAERGPECTDGSEGGDGDGGGSQGSSTEQQRVCD